MSSTTPSTPDPSQSSRLPILPPETLSTTLSTIELLSAMWSGADELHLTLTDDEQIRLLADYLSLPLQDLPLPGSQALKDSLAEEITLGLRVKADPNAPERAIVLNVGLPLRRMEGKQGKEGESNFTSHRMWVSAKDAPAWLGRAGVEEVNKILQADAGEEGDEVGSILERIEGVSEWLLTLPTPTTDAAPAEAAPRGESREVRRVWYYLPSLSTPSKRKDIVELARSSAPPFSGFLLAGKPGLIVLEYPLPSTISPSTPSLPTSSSSTPSSSTPSSLPGPSTPFASSSTPFASTPSLEATNAASLAMSSFWSEIKTTSWSDIPSSHKKISEVLTEPSVPPAFEGFNDITDWPEVEKGADRGRKSDLSKLIRWLDGRGVNGKWVLERCLGVGSWDS